MKKIDTRLLIKGPVKEKSLHINVRVTGMDAVILERLRVLRPDISDSQRVRDALRLSVYLLQCKDEGTLPVPDPINYLGLFT